MEFIEMNNQSGIFFREVSKTKISYDSFVLVYHIQLEDYYNIQEMTKKCFNSLIKVCKSQGSFCDALLLNLGRKKDRMNAFETNIGIYEPVKTRTKRNPLIAATALIASIAFGTLDYIRMSKYEQMIDELNADYNILHKIQTDETIFLKGNIIANKHTFQMLVNATDEMTTKFEEKMDRDYNEFTAFNRDIIITKVSELFDLWYDEHQHLSTIIIDHLENIKHGKMSHLIPMETFKSDLMGIEKMLPNNQGLPIDIHRENPLSMFNFITTRTSIHNKKLYIELTIPKVDRETYNLYKIIPIPIYINGYIMIIIPSMEYVLIDENQKSFTPLSNKEVDDNLLQYNWNGIITPNDNIYHDFHDNCEMSLFIHPNEMDIKELCNVRTLPIINYFISLGSLNQYFIVVTKPTTLMETCNSTLTKRQTINSSGKLTLTDKCQIRTHKITLRPRIQTRIEKNVEIGIFTDINGVTFDKLLENITKISKPQQLHFKKYSMLIDNHVEEFNQLADHADDLMEQLAYNSRFDDVQREKITGHIYVSTGLLIFVITIIGIFACFLYKKFYNVNTWTKLAGRLGVYRNVSTRTVRFESPDTIELQ